MGGSGMSKAKKELREEFYKKFVVSSIVGEAINDLGGVEVIWKWIEKALQQQREEMIRDMKNWTKGKKITKDKVREYLNKIK